MLNNTTSVTSTAAPSTTLLSTTTWTSENTNRPKDSVETWPIILGSCVAVLFTVAMATALYGRVTKRRIIGLRVLDIGMENVTTNPQNIYNVPGKATERAPCPLPREHGTSTTLSTVNSKETTAKSPPEYLTVLPECQSSLKRDAILTAEPVYEEIVLVPSNKDKGPHLAESGVALNYDYANGSNLDRTGQKRSLPKIPNPMFDSPSRESLDDEGYLDPKRLAKF